MRSRNEVEDYREELRESIPGITGEVQKEMVREQIFVLDRVLGLFDTGAMKDQFEIFGLLQSAQAAMKDTTEVVDRNTMKSRAAVKMYKWVLRKA